MKLEQIARHLCSLGFGVEGKTVFSYLMPKTVSSGILVVENSTVLRHQYQKGRHDGHFQVIVRSGKLQDARKVALDIMTALEGEGQKIGDMNFSFIRALYSPFVYPRSQESREYEASVNFSFMYVDKP